MSAIERPMSVSKPSVFVQHHLSTGLPRTENHFVAILIVGTITLVLEFPNYINPPLARHDPATTLHSHSLVNHDIFSLLIPTPPPLTREFNALLNGELLIINVRLIFHHNPFMGIEEIPAGGHYPVRLARFCHNTIKALGEEAMLVRAHKEFTSGNNHSCVDCSPHSTVLAKVNIPHPRIPY